MLVHIVVARFTDSELGAIHISVYESRKRAELIAKRVGGVVITRLLHWRNESDKNNNFGGTTTIPNED